MKTIGIDVSLDVCKAEGYTMIQFDARKKFNPDQQYRIFEYYPEYCEGYGGKLKADTLCSFNDLRELYERHEKGCNSFAETNKFVNFETPDYYDFLNLASDLLAYCGLD
jgi:hypothetical protein